MSNQDEGTLGIGVVARRTGLSADVLRVWERRHRAVAPGRSHGGTRLYSETDVRRLEVLARLVGQGHRIGRLAPLADEELQALDEPNRVAPTDEQRLRLAREPITQVGAEAPAGWLEEAIGFARNVDAAALESQMTTLFLALGPSRFTLEVALPLLVRVGEMWEAGELAIAAEHAASAVLRSLLGGALRHHRVRPSSQRVLFATPSDQRHEFGTLAAAVLAAGHGVDAIYLGADLPASDLALAAMETQAQAVILGLAPCAADTVAGEVGSELAAFRELLPRDIVLGVGGAIDDSLRSKSDLVIFESLTAFDEVIQRFGRVPSPTLLR